MEKILWLAIGYLFGSFQSGYFLGKAKGIDVRNYGSHSTGATNSLRVMGTGAGVLVLLLDAAKAIIPCVLARHFFAGQPELTLLMALWTATGVMLGHDYPFYLGFRGGKGVASTVGVLLALDWRVALAWCLLFIVTCFRPFFLWCFYWCLCRFSTSGIPCRSERHRVLNFWRSAFLTRCSRFFATGRTSGA